MKLYPQESQSEQYRKYNLRAEKKASLLQTLLHKSESILGLQSNTLMWQDFTTLNLLTSTGKKWCHKVLNYLLYSMLPAHMAVPGNGLIESHLGITKTIQV